MTEMEEPVKKPGRPTLAEAKEKKAIEQDSEVVQAFIELPMTTIIKSIKTAVFL